MKLFALQTTSTPIFVRRTLPSTKLSHLVHGCRLTLLALVW